ncbi:MAG TPA: GDP-mannose 4,6-dehydratase [Candidatus Dormibacteraeota bacterium]|nr:GDP-mannose 4,6-dehydratase [Candidatus Dormibacteraeota bacterium]
MPARASSTNWRGRVVLITGIGGFVGSELARVLLERGAKVVGVLRDSAGVRQLEARGIRRNLDLIYGSVTDASAMNRAVNEYEIGTVFHLAGQAIIQVANRSPIPTFESNIAGTWTILEAARLSPLVERVIVASSDKAYGDHPDMPYTEATPLHGRFPYDASKACTDILARCYAASYPLPVAVVRCSNVYGPGDTNWSRLIPGTVRAAVAGEDPVIRSDGTPERDYLYLSDAVDGYLSAAEHLPELSGEAVNFGTAQSVAALDLVRMILAEVGDTGLQPRILGESTGEISRQSLSFDKAHELLGWSPRVSLAEGLARTVAWYREYLEVGKVLALSSART